MSESESKEDPSRQSQRVRVKKSGRPKGRSWRESVVFRYLSDLLILLGLLLSIGLLFGPSTGIFDRATGNWRRFLQALMVNRVNLVLGALLLTITLGAAGYRLRRRIIHNRRLWMRRCPVCGSEDLRRARRVPRDRLLGLLGIPVRRYICPECRWVGARIDERRI